MKTSLSYEENYQTWVLTVRLPPQWGRTQYQEQGATICMCGNCLRDNSFFVSSRSVKHLKPLFRHMANRDVP